MKKILRFFLVIVLMIGISCEEEYLPRFGFDSPYNKNSTGLVLMHVGNKSDTIFLEGEIFVEEGGVEVELINPGNETVYAGCFESPGLNRISKIIPAGNGFWKLKYTSKKGAGSIDLHATF